MTKLMENNKQSSVEWLMQQIALKHGAFQAIAFYEDNFEIFNQAKAMHKEEMIQSCSKMQIIDDVDFDGNVTFIFDPEQYYNETYGGNK